MKLTFLGTSHGDPTLTRYNSSTLCQAGDEAYLIDAGTPVLASLIRADFDPRMLRAVFITHMHEDHFGGLPDLLKFLVKRPLNGQKTVVYVPEYEAIAPIRAFMAAAHRPLPDSLVSFEVIQSGIFFRKGDFTVKAVPTRHFENENLSFPSFAFVLKNAGEHCLYTGDLKYDFSDFPFAECGAEVSCVCELTHYPLENVATRLAVTPLRQLIFNHVGNRWHGKGPEEEFRVLTSGFPYPVRLAADGDSFEVNA